MTLCIELRSSRTQRTWRKSSLSGADSAVPRRLGFKETHARANLFRARALFRRAIDAGLPNDNLLFRTLWDLAALERKLGADQQAVTVWEDLAAVRNPFRISALEELAKHYEHRQKDPARALETTRAALAHEDTPALRRREERLVRRTASRSTVKRRRLL